MDKVLCGDVIEKLRELPDGSVQVCVTSPPYYGLRDYGVSGQIGLEETPEEYVEKMVRVFSEVRRVLRDDGTLWLNLGDSYAGSGKGRRADGTHQEGGKQGTNRGTIEGKLSKTFGSKPKDLLGIPWRVALALQAEGWYLRQDIIWHKPNPMPESVTDRCTKSHEYLFLLSKSPRYYFDHEAIKEPSTVGFRNVPNGKTCPLRNRRDVWTIPTRPYKGAHFAVFPEALVEPCVLAGSAVGGVVLDPFAGSGTSLAVAKRLGRKYVGIELNEKYLPLIYERLGKVASS